MLHPVGPLSAAVYWRRRLALVGLVLAVLIAVGFLAAAALGDSGGQSPVTAASTRSAEPTSAAPSLERVVPSLASVRVPTVPAATSESDPAPESDAAPESDPAPDGAPAADAPPAPVDGGPCTDQMISVAVRPGSPELQLDSKPLLDLVVTNTSAVSCVRPLDKQLQEIVLVDAAGAPVWGSNDCFPETGADLRTLTAGEAVVFPVVWSGLTSEPTCTAPRVRPVPGNYVLRGLLDTKVSEDVPVTLL